MHELTLGRIRKLAADGRAEWLTMAETVQVLAQAILALEQALQDRASKPSSALDPVLVQLLSPWLVASPASTLTLSALMDRIMDCFRSTASIEPELAVTSLDSTTLQLTLRWPSPSGVTTVAGAHGPASHD